MVETAGPRPALAELPTAVTIREVGPRDGLQGERPIPPEDRAALVVALAQAGCRRIEAASFVSERAVPAMGGAAEVITRARESIVAIGCEIVLTALVPNLRGAETALAAGIDEITVTVAASPTYNQKNVRRTIEESAEEIRRVAEEARASSVPVDAVISCAFGSPYEAVIAAVDVATLAHRLVEYGASEITLADTTGVADPRRIADVLEALSERLPQLTPGLHLHETRGTALVNAYAALGLGICRFDTSVGGLGGSPFADGAGGNLATEDFVSFLDGLGVATGIDLTRLLVAGELTADLVGRELASRVRSAR